MEVRRAAVALLRTTARQQPLTWTYRSLSSSAAHLRDQQPSQRPPQQQPQPAKPVEAAKDSSNHDSAAATARNEINEILDGSSMSFIKPASPRHARSGQSAASNSPSTSTSTPPGQPSSSLSALLDQLRGGGPPSSSRTPAFPGFDYAQDHAPTVAPPMALNSRLGRSVGVNERRSMDVARAFRTLDMRVASNMIRATANAQRFHERPGLRRKRLRSLRWRRRFKANFQAIVRRVEDMRRKGW